MAPSSVAAPPDAEAEQARAAGRGGLAVLVAKVFFIVTGLVQQALLPRAIGQADYGALARVFAASNVANNVLVASSTQGVSRTVAAAGRSEREALRAALRVHLVIAIAFAGLLAAVAPLYAWHQHAPGVIAPLMAMSGVLFIYGLYAPLIGYLNGRGLFLRQASLDVAAATLRTAGLLGVGWLFSRRAGTLAATLNTSPGVLGATCGAVLASVGVCLLALRWTGTGKGFSGRRPEGVPAVRSYLAVIVPIMVAQLCTNGLMQADIMWLGRYLSLSAAQTSLLPSVTAEQAANQWVAVYRACQLFAFLPYQLLFSVTQVLFPMVARAQAEDSTRVAEIVRRGCRIGAIVCGLLVVVVLVTPGSLIAFAYDRDLGQKGAATLRVLALGQAAFAILGLSTTVLVSLGRQRTALLITAVALVLLVGTCEVIIPTAPFGAPQLMAAATATTTALAGALVVGAIVVRRVAGAFVPWKTALRVGLCIAGAFALGGVTPMFSKALTPFVAAAVALAYLLALVVTGELGKSDLDLVLSIARRRKAA